MRAQPSRRRTPQPRRLHRSGAPACKTTDASRHPERGDGAAAKGAPPGKPEFATRQVSGELPKPYLVPLRVHHLGIETQISHDGLGERHLAPRRSHFLDGVGYGLMIVTTPEDVLGIMPPFTAPTLVGSIVLGSDSVVATQTLSRFGILAISQPNALL